MVPRMFARFLGLMNACGTVWIFLLMILINSDIIGRELFESPVRGTTEILSISIVGIVFLQLGHTLMNGKITRSDMVIDNLLAFRPRIGHALQCLFHLGGAVLLGIIFWGSIDLFTDAIAIQEYRSEEHTSELQSLMRISYAVFCLNKKTNSTNI